MEAYWEKKKNEQEVDILLTPKHRERFREECAAIISKQEFLESQAREWIPLTRHHQVALAALVIFATCVLSSAKWNLSATRDDIIALTSSTQLTAHQCVHPSPNIPKRAADSWTCCF